MFRKMVDIFVAERNNLASLRQAFDLVRNSSERYSINVERVK